MKDSPTHYERIMKMPTIPYEVPLLNDIHPHMTSLFGSYSPTLSFNEGIME